VVEESALDKLQRDKEALEVQAHGFVSQLARTWEEPLRLSGLLSAADDQFAGWVRSQADDLSALRCQVHRLRSLLAMLEQA
jgi:hypothetical protein